MARMLRSRSMRMLRGGHKETHQQEVDRATPPPDSFSEELDRRLKAAMPVSRVEERVETPDMSQQQRPRTSSGPGDRGKQFHKKVAPTASTSNDDHAFAFPFSNKSTSFLYTAEIHEERGVIGVALGSPTMASHSTSFVPGQQSTVTYISSNNASHNYLPEPVLDKHGSPKPKLSRWKSIFKKSPVPPQQTKFYQLAPEVPARMDSHHDNESIDSRTMSPLQISPPPFRPEIRESRRMPKGHPQPPIETRPQALTKPKSSFLRSASSPQPPPKDRSATVPQLTVSSSQSSSPRLLDVDIPSVEMERYSVMFGNLLQPHSNSAGTGSSSLLARRQGNNSERLKPLNELSKKNEEDGSRLKPQRRATSPSIPKGPPVGLSLFPQPTENDRRRTPSPRAISVHPTRPLQRSMTAPSSSPNRQNFSKPRPIKIRPTKASQSPQELQAETQPISQMLTPISTSSTRPSFDSDSEEVTIVVRAAPGQAWIKPTVSPNEPEWEILSKPNLTNLSNLSNLVQSPVSQDAPSSAPLESTLYANSTATVKITSPVATPKSADPMGNKNPSSRNNSMATIGLARSVSVSRANRPEFLKPVLVKRATEGAERLVDRQALTPTLVELKNRKSQRVQLVEA